MRVTSKSSGNSGISKPEALSLLEKEGCSEELKKHALAVSRHARGIAEKIRAKGHPIDIDFVEVGALLHDIGRCRTNGVAHGLEGAKMMGKISPRIARVCERHVGAGLDRHEAASLGLPARDFLPKTLEEKVIAHADNLVSGDKVVGIDEAVKEFEEKLGRRHPAVKRIRELNDYIAKLCENGKA